MASKKTKINKFNVQRTGWWLLEVGVGCGGEMAEGGPKVHTSRNETSHRDEQYSMATTIKNNVLHIYDSR